MLPRSALNNGKQPRRLSVQLAVSRFLFVDERLLDDDDGLMVFNDELSLR